MSIAALNWAFALPVKGAAKSVLLALANLANKDGIAWPSTSTISAQSGVAKRHVLRVLTDLERCGAIQIDRRNRAVSEYKLVIGNTVSGDTVSPDEPKPSGDMVSASGDISASGKAQSGDMVSQSGDMVSPKPLEPSKKENHQNLGAPAAPPPVYADARDQVWGEGLPIIRRLVGKGDGPSRALLGKMLKTARDDCPAVMRALRTAADLRPVDPVPWLMAALNQPDDDTRLLQAAGLLPTGRTLDGDALELFPRVLQ